MINVLTDAAGLQFPIYFNWSQACGGGWSAVNLAMLPYPTKDISHTGHLSRYVCRDEGTSEGLTLTPHLDVIRVNCPRPWTLVKVYWS